jgi:hypothetical protein
MMRRMIVGVVLLVGAGFAAGCESAPKTTGDACADVRTTMQRYTTDAPEFKAMNDEIEKRYKGAGDAKQLDETRAAYFKAFGQALRPIADEAKTPELKSAISQVADAYSGGNGDVNALQDVLKLCT